MGCNDESSLVIPQPDKDNGGLFLPDGFGALVVVDSVGPSRHLAVNNNGDIYIKLKITEGRLGNVAIRDTDNDGKADIVQRFGDYPNDGSFATEMRIHKGYLYFSSERVIYRQKLDPSKLIPEGKPGAGGYREHDILIIGKDSAENITKFPFGPEHNIIKN